MKTSYRKIYGLLFVVLSLKPNKNRDILKTGGRWRIEKDSYCYEHFSKLTDYILY